MDAGKQLDLFLDYGKNSVSFDLFKSHSDFEWFKTMKPLRINDLEALKEFYVNEYGFDHPPLYLGDVINAEIECKSKVRWMAIRFDHDIVLIVYKTFQFMGSNILHVFDKPIALHDESCALLVLKHLKALPFASFIFKEKYIYLYEKNKRKEIYDDYYYDLEIEKNERFSSRKWRQNARIPLILKNDSEYSFIATEKPSAFATDIMKCRETWWNGFKRQGIDMGIKKLRNALSISNGVIAFLLFYKKQLLAFSIDILHSENKYSICLFFSHVGRSKREIMEVNPGINGRVLSNLDDCMRYLSGTKLLDMGIRREYCLGYRPTETRLKEHKEVTTSGKIAYYIGK